MAKSRDRLLENEISSLLRKYNIKQVIDILFPKMRWVFYTFYLATLLTIFIFIYKELSDKPVFENIDSFTLLKIISVLSIANVLILFFSLLAVRKIYLAKKIFLLRLFISILTGWLIFFASEDFWKIEFDNTDTSYITSIIFVIVLVISFFMIVELKSIIFHKKTYARVATVIGLSLIISINIGIFYMPDVLKGIMLNSEFISRNKAYNKNVVVPLEKEKLKIIRFDNDIVLSQKRILIFFNKAQDLLYKNIKLKDENNLSVQLKHLEEYKQMLDSIKKYNARIPEQIDSQLSKARDIVKNSNDVNASLKKLEKQLQNLSTLLGTHQQQVSECKKNFSKFNNSASKINQSEKDELSVLTSNTVSFATKLEGILEKKLHGEKKDDDKKDTISDIYLREIIDKNLAELSRIKLNTEDITKFYNEVVAINQLINDIQYHTAIRRVDYEDSLSSITEPERVLDWLLKKENGKSMLIKGKWFSEKEDKDMKDMEDIKDDKDVKMYHPKLLIFQTFIAMFAGVFMQLLIQDKTVTESI